MFSEYWMSLRKVEGQATTPEKTEKKDEPVDEFTRNIVNGQEDLRLVFYDSEATEAKFFGIQAGMIAASTNAVRIPAACPAKRKRMKLAVGANPFSNGNILPVLKRATECTGRKISEIQVVGHLHTGVRFADAARYAPHVEQGIRLVFHGCSVLRIYPTDLQELLRHFGSEAEIFAHNVSGEAGRPYEFWRVTLPTEKGKIETELLKEVTFILPKSYIQKWTAMQSSARLYGLLRSKETEEQDDARLVITEELRKRLAKTVRAWSKKGLENRLKKPLYDWEKTVLESELARKSALTH